ncbi:MAG: selenide, water dikinase SelD, partial [Lachnospiraceae bacterium]
ADKVKEAGAVLVGGHSVQDDEPKYGLCVSGFVHPDKIFKNYGCKPGDVLILTKQIGNGIVNTAIKAELASEEAIEEAQTVMATLNKKGKEVVEAYPVTACTDVTGFGLLGHCIEMAKASDVTFEIQVNDIAYFKDAVEFAKMGLVPAGTYKNRGYSGDMVDMSRVEEYFIDLLYDPQTSGGLLISVPEEAVESMMKDFEKKNMETKVSIIGKVVEKGEKLISLY